MSGKTFGLIGAAGYVASRHMRAIRDVGGVLHAALDPNDSVGLIDSFFPDAHFFTEFERFDRHVDLMRRNGANRSNCSASARRTTCTMHIAGSRCVRTPTPSARSRWS